MPRKQPLMRVLERRVDMTRMYVQGFTQAEIAHKLKLDPSHVSTELSKIREDWLQVIVQNYDEIKSRELAKIDNLERTAWEAWEKSCKPATIKTKKVQSFFQTVEEPPDSGNESEEGEYIPSRKSVATPIKQHLESTKKGQNGNPAYLDRIAWCIEMRLKIFGILKEQKIENNTFLNFDSLVDTLPDDEDAAEQKILQVEASVTPDSHQPPHSKHPSSNGTNGDGHDAD